MGKYQRRKGWRGENEVVNKLKAAGLPTLRTAPLESGGFYKGDLMIAETWSGSVKIGKQVPKFIYDAKEKANFLFVRRDRERWLICMDLDEFLETFIVGEDSED